jgi:RNase P subunit RPR2
LEAAVLPRVLYCVRSSANVINEDVMKERTCAACDCALDANAIRVTIGGKTVEVCCDECAQKLREAIAGVDAPGRT